MSSFEEFESPYLENDLELVFTANELSHNLARAIDESPFAHLVEVPGTETSQSTQSGLEPQETEMLELDEPVTEPWTEEETEYEADEQTYDHDVPEEGDASTLSEWLMPEPGKTEHEEVRGKRYIMVVGARNALVTDGKYAFHQGNVTEKGKLDRNGRAHFSKIDPSQPFLFEVRDRVCAIRAGAFFDPDDAKIQYGGTAFDWTLVRDDKKADKTFWPHYQKEMDVARKNVNPRTVEKFLQHEHITRRPIQVAKPFLAQLGKVQIQALPCRVRIGPFVRYTDHERAVIWQETLTPGMIRARYKKAGGAEKSRYASTVRVGGRHFAAVEIDGLAADTFYYYTIELAPLPAKGEIPVDQGDFVDVFRP